MAVLVCLLVAAPPAQDVRRLERRVAEIEAALPHVHGGWTTARRVYAWVGFGAGGPLVLGGGVLVPVGLSEGGASGRDLAVVGGVTLVIGVVLAATGVVQALEAEEEDARADERRAELLRELSSLRSELERLRAGG